MIGKRRNDLLLMILAAAAATSALGQTEAPAAGPADGAASIPDFSGVWWHPSLPGFEPLASGPTSLTNRSRRNGVSKVQVQCQLGEEQKGVSPSHFYSLSPLFIDLDILVSLGMTQGQGQ